MHPGKRGTSSSPVTDEGDGKAGTFVLEPVPPFDFPLSCSIFTGGDPQVRIYEGGIYRQATRVKGRLVLLLITSAGTVDQPEMRVRIAPGPISPGERKAAGHLVTSLFNLDLDLSLFARAVQGDPVMSAIAVCLRGLKPPRTATVFEALADSIIEQQISLAAAHSIGKRVTRALGDILEIGGGSYYAFPTPGRLAEASPEELRACGLSLRKAEYITGIARRIRDGDLDLENHGPGEDTGSIIRELSTLRGVGLWTAELAVLRGLSRLDAIPADDLGIRRSFSHYYQKSSRIDPDEARRIAEAWGEWKGLAAYYLLVAERVGIGIPDLKRGEESGFL